MSVIKVQGETYQSVDDLNATIYNLEADLEKMPSDTPEHEKLAQHVAALRAAAEESGSGEPPASPAPVAEPGPDTADEENEEDKVEVTHSLRDAAENGKELVCPLCGHDIDFPEVPPLDPNVERCRDCKGWGSVLTGSRVDGHVWRNCPTCQGQGFTDEHSVISRIPELKAAATPGAPGALWNPETEQWDRPPGQQPPWAGAVWDSFLGQWG